MSVPYRTGQTQKRKEQAEIEQKTAEFLATGNEIRQLRSEQLKSQYTPAFNRSPEGYDHGDNPA